tara:strand:+ start:1262 stop:2953 length:1692 start_codon:yes stop_codon:yes gene_type:complete
MEFHYKKNDNTKLFTNLENKELTNIYKLQNYIPIYDRFFSLNTSNYNSINLNNYNIINIFDKESENKYLGNVLDHSNNIINKKIFFKYSPLLDPAKYITGKYDISENMLLLPQYDKKYGYAKIRDPNNSAYVDGFFSYLTSQLFNNFNFVHGIDFYGSFIGIKKNFIYDITDEIDFLYESDFFHENNNKLFKLEDNIHSHLLNKGTRKNKLLINITDDIYSDISNINIISSDSQINDINALFINESNKSAIENDGSNIILCYEGKIDNTSDDDSINTCSSSSSYSEENFNASESENDDESDDNSSILSDDTINININDFPINLITLERCHDTFDKLITDNKISDEELSSIIIQILMILITYQKIFKFTHNDLHTNNIMYVLTDKKYLFYKYNNKKYKIPTFGKIFKIIDFGRAIYTFRKQLIYSDSYHEKGDAATQYNFGPYLNSKKPLLEPNYSFDLCRLGCSMYDYFIDSFEEEKEIKSGIINIILKWCYDDKGRNILYKSSGEERYPEFKLYKMIARSVHNHVPSDVIKNNYFDKYVVSNKHIKKNKNKIFDIDGLSCEY